MSSHASPEDAGFVPVHFSFNQGPDYWERKGSEIAYAVLEKLEHRLPLDYAVILPARKRTTSGKSFEQLIAAAMIKDPNDYYVSSDEPVVRGFIRPFNVGSFEDLPDSSVLKLLDLQPEVEIIFDALQYKDQEKTGLTGGLYLPAVRVDFLPIKSETA